MTGEDQDKKKEEPSGPRTQIIVAIIGAAALVIAGVIAGNFQLASSHASAGSSVSPTTAPPTAPSPPIRTSLTPTSSPSVQTQGCTDFAGTALGVTSLAFSTDGDYLVGGGSNGHIYLWDVGTQQIAAQFQDPATQGIRAVAFNPDGQFAALDANGHIYQYGHSLAATFTAPGVTSLAFSARGDHLADVNPNSQASLCRANDI
jgi:WD domain, G-beta repeat